MVVRMPQLWSSHHCCGSWVVITILLKMVNAKDGGLLWDIPSFQLTEVRHGSNTYLILGDYFLFFLCTNEVHQHSVVCWSSWAGESFNYRWHRHHLAGAALFGTGGGIRTDQRTPPREEFYSCGLSDYSLRTDLNGSWHWPTHMKVRMVRMVFE